MIIARVAGAEPRDAPPDAAYVAAAGSVSLGARSESTTVVGIDGGYRFSADPWLVHGVVLLGHFEPVSAGGADPPIAPSGSYLATRGGIETDACGRGRSCLIFGADLGYVQEHASASSVVDAAQYERAVVVVGRLGLELRNGAVRFALTAEGQVGYGTGFAAGYSPNAFALVVTLGGRMDGALGP